MKQFSIRQYVEWLTLIPMLIMAVSLEAYFLHDRSQYLDRDLMERGKLIARQLASGSEYGVFSNNQSFLRNIAQGVLQQPDVRGVIILNAASERLIELGELSNKPGYLDSTRKMPDSQAGELVNLKAPVFSSGESLWVYQPIIPVQMALDELGAKPVVQQAGAVIIEMGWAGTEKLKAQMFRVTIGVTALFLSLSFLLVYLASRRITSPIRKLSEAVQMIGNGHLETRISVPAVVAELSNLAHGINAMADAVQANNESMEANNLTLGHRVAERTMELKEQNINLAKSMSLLQATLESTHDAILVVDLNNIWVLHNQRFIDLWHITDEVIASKDDSAALLYVLDQLEDADGFLNKVRELYATPEASSSDIINFKDGRIIERSSIPQLIGGKVVGRVWSFRDITERKIMADRLAHLAQVRALSDERQRIMQDMHDGFGSQLISSLIMVEHGHADPVEIAQLLRDCIDDLRLVIDTLASDEGEKHTDFLLALGTLRQRMETRLRPAGIDFSWHQTCPCDTLKVAPRDALQVLRILHEAICNVVKHAKATAIQIVVTADSAAIGIRITDNGRGFDAGAPAPGRGIGNMKKRVRELGGVLELSSSGAGTQLYLNLPRQTPG